MNIFDFAIDMEQSGRDFYQQLAQTAEQEGVRNIFQRVADDEQQIMERLRRMRATSPHPEQIESATLIRLRNIFHSGRNIDKGCHLADDLGAYRFAIEAQSRLQKLYETAASQEESQQARILLKLITREEQREVESLQQLFDFANAPNEFLAWGEFSNLEDFHNFGRDEG